MGPIFVTPSVSCWIGIVLLCSAASGVGAYQKIITAESGQNITLTCRVPNNNNIIIVVEWSRADLGTEYVLLYMDERFDPEDQHPSFKNRVDLQDRQMKDGDVSLILKDVTTDDAGTYECRVVQRRTNRWRRANLKTAPISIINLRVVAPPGPGGGTTEDGGKKDGASRQHGLVSPVVFLLLLIAVFVIALKLQKNLFCHSGPAVA